VQVVLQLPRPEEVGHQMRPLGVSAVRPGHVLQMLQQNQVLQNERQGLLIVINSHGAHTKES
jgi:hypothetical protein